MLTAKSGAWWEKNPQRALANNSAVLVRHKITRKVYDDVFNRLQESGSGEPGIFWSNESSGWGTNPCGEISLRSNQFCNLSTINFTSVNSQEDLEECVRAAAFIGTLQASYTNLHYLSESWKKTTEKEALIGVSMTGMASTHLRDFDFERAAQVVLEENARVASILGINPAARTTCVKPEGTTSLVLGSSSGVHAWHSQYYIRRVRVMKNEPVYRYLYENCPYVLEDDAFKPDTQAVASFPIAAPEGAITREESALDLLDRVSYIYQNWIKPGHRKGSNHNNTSCTVTVKPEEWKDVREWMWNHRDEYTGLAVLPYDGGTYKQPPLEEIPRDMYEQMLGLMPEHVDFSEIVESQDLTDLKMELACFAGQCEVA
jgi:ribonucleoside-diphosphate reductase alpha chain